jgi:hypothetical protein
MLINGGNAKQAILQPDEKPRGNREPLLGNRAVSQIPINAVVCHDRFGYRDDTRRIVN